MNAITVKQNGTIRADQDILGLVEDWRRQLELQVLTGEISANTQGAYLRGWSRFQDWLLSQDVDQVDSDVIRMWLASLKEAGNKPNSANVWLAGVRSFFAWAVGARRLLINPTSGVKSAKRKGTNKKHLRDMLTNAEVKRVLSQPDRNTPAGKRDYAVLALMAYTAVRSIEIHRADLADLKTEGDRLVLYVQGKGSQEKDEVVVIAHPAAEGAIHDWLAARGNKAGALFLSLSNRSRAERLGLRAIRGLVKGYYRAVGVHGAGKTTHSLRHTAITNAVLHGAPVQKVKSMARHVSIDTTMTYYHEVDRLEDPAEGYIDYEMRLRSVG